MQTIPCPGCRTELGPEITVCPICTRPRSKYEITRAYATLRAMEEKRRKRPFIIGGYLLAFAVIGGLYVRFQAPVRAAFAAGRSKVERFIDQARDPGRLIAPAATPKTAPVPPASPAEAAAAASAFGKPTWSPPPPIRQEPTPKASGPVMAAPPPAGPAGAEPPPPTRKRPKGDLPLKAMDASEWALRGSVYDLATLTPVADAVFSVRYNERLEASFKSDEDGRYMVVLRRVTNGGFELSNRTEGYAPAVYSESDVPYAQLTPAERRDMAETARAGDVHPTPITDISGEDSIHRDLFVVPRR